jgi:hypothetical protein
MATEDATLQSLNYLDDPVRYAVIRGVPIFRAHSRTGKDADGRPTSVMVTEADLAEIARNMSLLERYYGVAARVTDGHINPRPEAPESAQPELLGFARNARPGHFGPAATPAVLVDFFIRKDRLEKFRQRPYRSAEYYPPTKEIRGIGLLIRDPGLDLGIVTYDRANAPYLYAMENTVAEPSKEPQSKVEDTFTPEETAQFEKMCRYLAKKGFIKYSAADTVGPGSPSGGDTTVPPVAGDKKKEPVANARDQHPELYARLEAAEKRAADSDGRVAKLLEEREREKCVALVKGLVTERYMLDEEMEVTNLVGKTSKEREAHIAYIRKTHAQLPGGREIEVYSGHVEGAPSQTTESQMKRAVTVATKKGIDYDAALDLVKSGKA